MVRVHLRCTTSGAQSDPRVSASSPLHQDPASVSRAPSKSVAPKRRTPLWPTTLLCRHRTGNSAKFLRRRIDGRQLGSRGDCSFLNFKLVNVKSYGTFCAVLSSEHRLPMTKLLDLRQGWFEAIVANTELPEAGIYEWRIECPARGVSIYVGKSKKLRSRLREYKNNIRKLLSKAGYRKSNPNGFREIHRELYRAYEADIIVRYRILQAATHGSLNELEQVWIRQRRTEADSGGFKFLNSDLPSRMPRDRR